MSVKYRSGLLQWSRQSVEYCFIGLTISAVAEAWVASDRKHLYASSDGLGQSFSFDLLACSYKPDEFRKTIKLCLDDADRIGAPSTWVFSSELRVPSLPYSG